MTRTKRAKTRRAKTKGTRPTRTKQTQKVKEFTRLFKKLPIPLQLQVYYILKGQKGGGKIDFLYEQISLLTKRFIDIIIRLFSIFRSSTPNEREQIEIVLKSSTGDNTSPNANTNKSPNLGLGTRKSPKTSPNAITKKNSKPKIKSFKYVLSHLSTQMPQTDEPSSSPVPEIFRESYYEEIPKPNEFYEDDDINQEYIHLINTLARIIYENNIDNLPYRNAFSTLSEDDYNKLKEFLKSQEGNNRNIYEDSFTLDDSKRHIEGRYKNARRLEETPIWKGLLETYFNSKKSSNTNNDVVREKKNYNKILDYINKHNYPKYSHTGIESRAHCIGSMGVVT